MQYCDNLMLFEDSLFVYPLGNDFDKLRGNQSEKFSFWNTNSTANTIFLKSGFYQLL